MGKPELIGIVLCGGSSQRFGKDKALAAYNGELHPPGVKHQELGFCVGEDPTTRVHVVTDTVSEKKLWSEFGDGEPVVLLEADGEEHEAERPHVAAGDLLPTALPGTGLSANHACHSATRHLGTRDGGASTAPRRERAAREDNTNSADMAVKRVLVQ
mgnify:CR=1 FL=1